MPPDGGLRSRRYDKVVLFAEHRPCIFKPRPIRPARSSRRCTASPPPARSPTPTAPASMPPRATSSASASIASVMTSPSAAELQALAANPALANEAVSFATVMAFVDGKLDGAKLKAVLALAGKLGVKEDYRRRRRQARAGTPARRHRAHDPRQSRKRHRPSDRDRRPDAGSCPTKTKPTRRSPRASMRSAICRPTLSATPSRLLQGEQIRISRRVRPALNFTFATPHDSSHVLAGYDTSPRGELLVSTFTAAMHRKEAMAGTCCR